MAHLSEADRKIKKIILDSSFSHELEASEVAYLQFPFYESLSNIPEKSKLIDDFNAFIENSSEGATITFLSSPIFAAEMLANLTGSAYFKLWIGVKLKDPIISSGQLDKNHAALVIITRYKEPIRHTKTRIGYSFCPSCDKTTKDYGGKKHLYHDFGTLMSDVWRDESFDYNAPDWLINRLIDLFSIPEYKSIKCIDFSSKYASVDVNNTTLTFDESCTEFSYLNSSDSDIINGDCLKVLKEIPSDSIDFCFADPPYNVNKKYENWNDDIHILEYFDWCDKWLNELARIIKPGKTVAILNIPQWVVRHYKCLTQSLNFQDWIIWEGLSLPLRGIMPAHYPIICFTKGNPKSLPGLLEQSNYEDKKDVLSSSKEFYCGRNSCVKKRLKNGEDDKVKITNLWWDIHRLKHNSKRVDHPTQLPPLLMKRLISLFTNEGDIVLDPFNGSGTTSLCANILNRKYFGIELSEKYFQISLSRHDELKNGIDPFRKRDVVPKSKNSNVKRQEVQKYKINKKTLQLEVKEISKLLGRIPSREDVINKSIHPIEHFDEYFKSWTEVTAAARTTGMQNVELQQNYLKNISIKDGTS